jgi:hypothetical protein
MGMNWQSRLVSFAESIAIGPKTSPSQRAYASRSPLIVADMQVDVHHPIRMIATAIIFVSVASTRGMFRNRAHA